VRYPSDLRPKILICMALLVNLICAGGALISPGSLLYNCFAGLLLLGSTALYIHWWPTTLVTDQRGLHSLWILGRRRQFIAWDEIGEISDGFELGMEWAAALGVTVDVLVVSNLAGDVKIAHTSRHPDRERMLKEFQLHGVAASAHHAPPVAPGV
jgi:hypothetical protein